MRVSEHLRLSKCLRASALLSEGYVPLRNLPDVCLFSCWLFFALRQTEEVKQLGPRLVKGWEWQGVPSMKIELTLNQLYMSLESIISKQDIGE